MFLKKLILIIVFCVLILLGCQSADSPEVSNHISDKKTSIENFIEQHTDLEIVYTLVADINGDYKPESFLVSGREAPKLWYIDNSGRGRVIVDAIGSNYLNTELVDRGKEKHIAFMTYYEPSNTDLWVIKMTDGLPEIVFQFMADWEIRVSRGSFDMTWKKYNSNPDEGGYDLVVDKYYWEVDQGKYVKQ